MEDNTIKEIVIVGGGVAGGLSALYLKTFLGNKVNISVIAPTLIPPMTVGESTNGPFTGFLEALGISRETLIKKCDATIKVASEFENWTPIGKGYKWTHEFQPNTTHQGIPLFHYWLHHHKKGSIDTGYQDACFLNSNFVKQNRVPFETSASDSKFQHGYHLDGTKLSSLLRDMCLEKGIRWIDDQVSAVTKNGDGFIQSLILKSGASFTGQFFVDCTGFRRTLPTLAFSDTPDKVLFDSFSDYLHCDSSIHFTLPNVGNEIRPSTLGYALSSGWVWDIPIQGKVSYGYVFSSKFQSKESAEREFRAFIGRGDDVATGFLKWTPGMQQRAWVKNCVSVGVSNAFIEPIESLTSATLTVELRNLLLNFPNTKFHRVSIDRYNKVIGEQCLDNRDFVSLHYATGGREDSAFWRAVKSETKRSSRVEEFLINYRKQAPHTMLGIYDIKAIFGMCTAREIFPEDDFPLLHFVDHKGALNLMHAIQTENAQLHQRYLMHHEYIAEVKNQ